MPTEVEAKFRADGPRPLELLRRAATLGPATLREARVAEEHDRYIDSADGRLEAALWACRLRTRDGHTRLSLKGPAQAGSGGGLHRRPELEGPADHGLDPGGWLPSDARALLERLVGGAPLVERFALAQRRTERAMQVGDRHVGTLSLDEVEVLAEARSHGRFRVVEVELRPDAGAADMRVLEDITTHLRRIDGLAPEDHTKLERALELIGQP